MPGYIFKTKHKKNPIRDSLNKTPRESCASEIEKTAVAAERFLLNRCGAHSPCLLPRKTVSVQKQMITLSLHLPLHSALQRPAHNMDLENTKPNEMLIIPSPATVFGQ